MPEPNVEPNQNLKEEKPQKKQPEAKVSKKKDIESSGEPTPKHKVVHAPSTGTLVERLEEAFNAANAQDGDTLVGDFNVNFATAEGREALATVLQKRGLTFEIDDDTLSRLPLIGKMRGGLQSNPQLGKQEPVYSSKDLILRLKPIGEEKVVLPTNFEKWSTQLETIYLEINQKIAELKQSSQLNEDTFYNYMYELSVKYPGQVVSYDNLGAAPQKPYDTPGKGGVPKPPGSYGDDHPALVEKIINQEQKTMHIVYTVNSPQYEVVDYTKHYNAIALSEIAPEKRTERYNNLSALLEQETYKLLQKRGDVIPPNVGMQEYVRNALNKNNKINKLSDNDYAEIRKFLENIYYSKEFRNMYCMLSNVPPLLAGLDVTEAYKAAGQSDEELQDNAKYKQAIEQNINENIELLKKNSDISIDKLVNMFGQQFKCKGFKRGVPSGSEIVGGFRPFFKLDGTAYMQEEVEDIQVAHHKEEIETLCAQARQNGYTVKLTVNLIEAGDQNEKIKRFAEISTEENAYRFETKREAAQDKQPSPPPASEVAAAATTTKVEPEQKQTPEQQAPHVVLREQTESKVVEPERKKEVKESPEVSAKASHLNAKYEKWERFAYGKKVAEGTSTAGQEYHKTLSDTNSDFTITIQRMKDVSEKLEQLQNDMNKLLMQKSFYESSTNKKESTRSAIKSIDAEIHTLKSKIAEQENLITRIDHDLTVMSRERILARVKNDEVKPIDKTNLAFEQIKFELTQELNRLNVLKENSTPDQYKLAKLEWMISETKALLKSIDSIQSKDEIGARQKMQELNETIQQGHTSKDISKVFDDLYKASEKQFKEQLNVHVHDKKEALRDRPKDFSPQGFVNMQEYFNRLKNNHEERRDLLVKPDDIDRNNAKCKGYGEAAAICQEVAKHLANCERHERQPSNGSHGASREDLRKALQAIQSALDSDKNGKIKLPETAKDFFNECSKQLISKLHPDQGFFEKRKIHNDLTFAKENDNKDDNNIERQSRRFSK